MIELFLFFIRIYERKEVEKVWFDKAMMRRDHAYRASIECDHIVLVTPLSAAVIFSIEMMRENGNGVKASILRFIILFTRPLHRIVDTLSHSFRVILSK